MAPDLGAIAELGALKTDVPRANLVRYHGVLAPASTWRAAVVPSPAEERGRTDYEIHQEVCFSTEEPKRHGPESQPDSLRPDEQLHVSRSTRHQNLPCGGL